MFRIMNEKLRNINHKVDLCVVGGGLAEMCTAVAAARHGIKVALMHDRPVYGGNASSEIRMWVCGAHSDNNRETSGAGKFVKEKMNSCNVHKDSPALNVPKTLVRSLKAELLDKNGAAREINGVENNHQRLVRLKVGERAYGIRFTLLSTNGNEKAEIYSIDIKECR